MATYQCSKCCVKKATFRKCDNPLANDILKLYDHNQAQISKCSDDHDKIKSPLCCGQYMSSTV